MQRGEERSTEGRGEEHGELRMVLSEGRSGPNLVSALGPGCFSAGLTVSMRPTALQGPWELPCPHCPPTLGLGPELSGADIHCLAGPLLVFVCRPGGSKARVQERGEQEGRYSAPSLKSWAKGRGQRAVHIRAPERSQRRSECAGPCGGVRRGVLGPLFQLLLRGDLECQVPPSHTRGS